MIQGTRRFLGGPVEVDLVRLVEMVVGQVVGGDERAALEGFLLRARPGEQVVTVDLAEVIENGRGAGRVGAVRGPGGLFEGARVGGRGE